MINKIKLSNFRKYSFIELNVGYNLVILIGPNACGKTSILESIFLCSTSKSHRTNNYLEMIKENEKFSKIDLESDDLKINVILSEHGKKTSINKVEIKKISEFIGNLKTVLFSPSDLNLVIGEKILRRNFFDLEISLLDKQYLNLINEYKKILKNRNEILKNNVIDEVLLNVITTQLIDRAKNIIKIREKFINDLNNELKLLDSKLSSNELFKIIYNKSINTDIFEFYKNKLNYDKVTKMTNYGPHRDDYIFYMNDKLIKNYCSQGQIRSFAIMLKIALFNLILKKTNKSPILLLDDVFSELDLNRQENLVSFLIDKPQTFITTTNLEGIPSKLLNKSHIINLKE